MEAVAPGCHYEGHIEHWACTGCETVWADEALTQVTNHKNVIIPELGGEVKHVEAKAASCGKNGNIEYWYCEECEQFWQDEARTQLTNSKNVIIPAVSEHEWSDWDITEATCTKKGKQTHECEICGKTETKNLPVLDHTDKDKDEECDICGADLDNAKTGDMIMISVVIMVLAAAAIVVLLLKKRREV